MEKLIDTLLQCEVDKALTHVETAQWLCDFVPALRERLYDRPRAAEQSPSRVRLLSTAFMGLAVVDLGSFVQLIGKDLDDPAILPDNVYSMDEIGILLSVS
jgi:hypothetical protein